MLLLTLGSPDEPTTGAVRRYLTQFLTDPLVIDIPWISRQLLVRGIIAPFRAPKSAEAYRKIWTKDGSPLIVFTQQFADKVREQLSARFDVRWAARYGRPGVESILSQWDVDELYVVPLYPQYATSSTLSALEEVRAVIKASGRNLKLKVLRDFFVEPEFIQSQSRRIMEEAERFRPDHYLLSFHGLPVHHLTKLHPEHCQVAPGCCEKVDATNRWCYRAQSMATARTLVTAMNLSPEKVTVAFQSRLGRRPWIQPYTDQVVDRLAADGVRRLLVSCPSFIADCLETLEEIQMRLREQFLEKGGEDLKLVPALNAEDYWVQDFSQMLIRHNLYWWDG